MLSNLSDSSLPVYLEPVGFPEGVRSGPFCQRPYIHHLLIPSAHILSFPGVSPTGVPGASFLTLLSFYVLLSEMISNECESHLWLIVRLTK